MDISVQVVWSFALALFLTLVLPILLLLFLCLFKKISPLPMALGLLSFFISQILLRIPLLQLCAGPVLSPGAGLGAGLHRRPV